MVKRIYILTTPGSERVKDFFTFELLNKTSLTSRVENNLPHLLRSYVSWKTLKVMEFYNIIFQAWKVMEFECGSWKVVEND